MNGRHPTNIIINICNENRGYKNSFSIYRVTIPCPMFHLKWASYRTSKIYSILLDQSYMQPSLVHDLTSCGILWDGQCTLHKFLMNSCIIMSPRHKCYIEV